MWFQIFNDLSFILLIHVMYYIIMSKLYNVIYVLHYTYCIFTIYAGFIFKKNCSQRMSQLWVGH